MYSITPCHKDGLSKGTHTGRNVRPLTEDPLLNHTKDLLESYHPLSQRRIQQGYAHGAQRKASHRRSVAQPHKIFSRSVSA